MLRGRQLHPYGWQPESLKLEWHQGGVKTIAPNTRFWLGKDSAGRSQGDHKRPRRDDELRRIRNIHCSCWSHEVSRRARSSFDSFHRAHAQPKRGALSILRTRPREADLDGRGPTSRRHRWSPRLNPLIRKRRGVRREFRACKFAIADAAPSS
jgi:hypothetical protein